MTSSRPGFLAAMVFLAAGVLGAQSLPKDLPWAVERLQGEGDWAVRLPQLLVRTWASLPDHRVTDAEKAALKQSYLDDSLRAALQQESQLVLALDKKRLLGPLPSTEPAATQKSLADLDLKVAQARAGTTPGAVPPDTLAFRAVWPSGKDGVPWTAQGREDLQAQSQALYLVTGTVKTAAPYLLIRLELYSTVEERVLVSWEDTLAPDEAAARMAEASDRFREALFGRPWAGLVATGTPGTRILVAGTWHDLPWASDDLQPGALDIGSRAPGQETVTSSVVLEAGKRVAFSPPVSESTPDRLVLETDPVGASLFLDSQYLGPSPQTVDRPLATARVRAQAPGMAALAWEVGPKTASPSRGVLGAPKPAPSVDKAKDGFYWSLAAFSASLTSSAFVGAWFAEQVQLTNAYATASYTNKDQAVFDNYDKATFRTTALRVGYAGSVVLTCGVFVWMMFELGDYLGAAQSTLP